MPELPEVETTRRGLEPRLVGRRIERAVIRERRLRRPIPKKLPEWLAGAKIRSIGRRGKYLLIGCGHGTLIVHLGMSGRLWVVASTTPAGKHDHFDLVLDDGRTLRFKDPRRFGLLLWCGQNPLAHPLLKDIGPEPLTPAFGGEYLHRQTRSRSAAIKLVLMDSRLVAGIGNIYASEALFRAGIRPSTPARRLSRARCDVLAEKVRETLQDAIVAGGSSLRDYVNSAGEAGFFQDKFNVYDRAGEACFKCATAIKGIRQGQRATYYCPRCQR